MTHTALIEEMRERLEDTLRRVLAEAESSLARGLQDMLTYHLGWSGEDASENSKGKRIRPMLTLLTCAGVCGEWEIALPSAASVELLHNFSLIHDDIQDESPSRRGRATLWKLWGPAQSINAGDALFALAMLSPLLPTPDDQAPTLATAEVVRVLSQACLHLTQGQFVDLASPELSQFGLRGYWEMVERKTAALLQAACAAGAILGGASPERRRDLEEYGRNLGLAFQAQDDVLGLWGDPALTGKSSTSDLLSHKKSLPILYGLENSQAFREMFASPEGEKVAPEMLAELEGCGARQFALEQAASLTGRAYEALRRAKLTREYEEELRELTEALLQRER